jgi:hypothetical protein
MLKAILVILTVSGLVLGCAKKDEPTAANAPGATTAPGAANGPAASQNPNPTAQPSKTPEESGREHVNAGRDKAKEAGKEFAAGALDLLKAKVDEQIDRNNKDKTQVTSSSEKPKDPVKQ